MIGRVNAIKMISLPRFLDLFQNLDSITMTKAVTYTLASRQNEPPHSTAMEVSCRLTLCSLWMLSSTLSPGQLFLSTVHITRCPRLCVLTPFMYVFDSDDKL
ncbi:hypothetical protein XENOCAPTIV_013470 [Xenoophorus captivus]|uniref:Uncharacterized protein n=1 Tax=Xenoophorus captivus TaxID=1517983 RepID=A0ABV0RSY9_9TELE